LFNVFFFTFFFFWPIIFILCFFKQKLGVKAPPVRIDSQAKYGALARGDGAIYLRFPHKGYREKIWDHAAGSIVVTGTLIIYYISFELPLPRHDREGNQVKSSGQNYIIKR
jgi:Inositol monophosphatase family